MSDEKKDKRSNLSSTLDMLSNSANLLSGLLQSDIAKSVLGTYENGKTRNLADAINGEYLDAEAKAAIRKHREELRKAGKTIKPVIAVEMNGKKKKGKKKKDKKKKKKSSNQILYYDLPKKKKKGKKKNYNMYID